PPITQIPVRLGRFLVLNRLDKLAVLEHGTALPCPLARPAVVVPPVKNQLAAETTADQTAVPADAEAFIPIKLIFLCYPNERQADRRLSRVLTRQRDDERHRRSSYSGTTARAA